MITIDCAERGRIRVRVAGDWTKDTSAALYSLEGMLGSGEAVELDLSGCTAIGHDVIWPVVRGWRTAEANGHEFRLVGANPAIVEVLRGHGMGALMDGDLE